jgi:hypothetical protein
VNGWDALPWVMSAVTLYAMYLAGNKSPVAWMLGLGNQALWLLFIVHTAAWGLLPMLVGMVVIYSRNLLKWKREASPRMEYSRIPVGSVPSAPRKLYRVNGRLNG